MPIDGYLVQFKGPMSATDASRVVGDAFADQGALARLAEGATPVDAERRLWMFSATYEVARLNDADAWELGYQIKRRSNGFVVRAEPTVVTEGMADDESYGEGLVPLGWGRGRAHLPESNDPRWAVDTLRVPGAVAALSNKRPGEIAGAGVIIGHPDTGLAEHPEVVLGTSIDMVTARNFMEVGTPAIDPLTGRSAGHGDATASVFLSPSTIAIQPGVEGVSPGATLVPLRMQDWVVHFRWGRLTQALYHAVDSGCHIVSMSLGGIFAGDTLRDAVRYAADRGVILIAAAGNYTGAVISPAKFPEVIAITATNARDRLWSGSATGRSVDIAAPGESVWRGRAVLDQYGRPMYTVERSAGTSYSVALTAGVCALWMHYHGVAALRDTYGAELGNVFRLALQQSAREPFASWPSDDAGAGVVDAETLLATPLPSPSAVTSMTNTRAATTPYTNAGSRLDEIAHIWNVSPTAARQRLSEQIGADAAAVDDLLSEYGAELSLQLHRNSWSSNSAASSSEPLWLSGVAPQTVSPSLLSALGGSLP